MKLLLTLFFCGDVMTGRGIDQALPHPNEPVLYEAYVQDARDYVGLAENRNGPIQQPVTYSYPWGDALAVLDEYNPDARIINLETAITRSNTPWPGKGIHYRMHPKNLPVLTAANIDVCALANNHGLDWGVAGFMETLRSLRAHGIRTAGLGWTPAQAWAPAIVPVENKGRVIVFSLATTSSGVLSEWGVTDQRPGVAHLERLSGREVRRIRDAVQAVEQPGDIIVVSIHWGGNWGYAVPRRHRAFAHRLIDEAGVDILHGHSSHHPRPIEVYRNKLILYGCGDFLNDYEGISGHENYRGDLRWMYFPSLDSATGRLTGLRMVPLQMKNFQLHHADPDDAQWMQSTLNRENQPFGTELIHTDGPSYELRWDYPPPFNHTILSPASRRSRGRIGAE